MIFSQINPLNKSVAISEILILMAIAAFLGWLIGRWITYKRISSLRQVLSDRRNELDSCHNQCISSAANTTYAVSYTSDGDNLKVIEGIGPKIEKVLKSYRILTFDQLAKMNHLHLSDILKAAGPSFQLHDPTSWPQQSVLARDGKWTELSDLQQKLDGGRIV